MAEKTGIEWTDSTFNPWIGCTNVSAGCDHCYAESMNAYRGWVEWGPKGKRRRTSAANWNNPRQWQKGAAAFYEKHKRRRRVFCASLADVFDNRAPEGARDDLWSLIQSCPDLDWQLLTKRPQNIIRFLPKNWGDGYENVWLGITAEDQISYDQRWPVLRDIPAKVRFISYEPAISSLQLYHHEPEQPDWVISGGESGAGRKTRIMNPDWARRVQKSCTLLKIPFFHKQWGDYRSNPLVQEFGYSLKEAEKIDPKSNGKGGGLIDGNLYREFPK